MRSQQIVLALALMSPFVIAAFFLLVAGTIAFIQWITWLAYYYYKCYKRRSCGASAIVPKTEE